MTQQTGLTPSERRVYREARAQGEPARFAYLIATKDRGGPDVPIESGEKFEREGFTLKVEIESDHYATPEDMGLGLYTSKWEEGCTLDRKREGYHVGRDQHPYFRPENTFNDHVKSGATREEARKYVLQDLKRAEGYPEQWYYLTVRVVVYRAGIELGSSCVGGIESDIGDRYLRETVDEQADEALAEAKDALETLCQCGDKQGVGA